PSASATGFQSASVVRAAERGLPTWSPPLPAPPLDPELQPPSTTAKVAAIATLTATARLLPTMSLSSVRLALGLSPVHEVRMKLVRASSSWLHQRRLHLPYTA